MSTKSNCAKCKQECNIECRNEIKRYNTVFKDKAKTDQHLRKSKILLYRNRNTMMFRHASTFNLYNKCNFNTKKNTVQAAEYKWLDIQQK